MFITSRAYMKQSWKFLQYEQIFSTVLVPMVTALLLSTRLGYYQWRNFLPGCPWVPVAQIGIDAPGGVILGTTQLT